MLVAIGEGEQHLEHRRGERQVTGWIESHSDRLYLS